MNRQPVDLERLKALMRNRQPVADEPTPQEILSQLQNAPVATGYREGAGVAGMGEALRHAKELTIGSPEDALFGDTWLERLFGVTAMFGIAPGGRLMNKAIREMARTVNLPRYFNRTPKKPASLGSYILHKQVVDPAIERYRSDREAGEAPKMVRSSNRERRR